MFAAIRECKFKAIFFSIKVAIHKGETYWLEDIKTTFLSNLVVYNTYGEVTFNTYYHLINSF